MEQQQEDFFTSDYKGISVKFHDTDNRIIFQQDRFGKNLLVTVNGKAIGTSNPSLRNPELAFTINDTEYSIVLRRKGFSSQSIECTLNKEDIPLQRYLLTAKSQKNGWLDLVSAIVFGALLYARYNELIPHLMSTLFIGMFLLLRFAIKPIKQWSCEVVDI